MPSSPTDDDAPSQPKLGERYRSLGDDVYEALLAQLISLKIAPGSRIAVDALVRDLGVSQTPIRAALIRLETEGLVVKTHHVGYSAAPMPSRARFEQMYELRLLLEPPGAAMAAARLTRVEREQLQQLASDMAHPVLGDAKVAYGKFAVLDAQFHAAIAKASGNQLLDEALARLYAHTHLFRLRFHSHVTEEAVKEHAAIVTALVQGDAAAVSQAMHEHIRCSRDRMAPFFDLLD